MKAPKATAEYGSDGGYSTRQDGGSMASQVYDRLMQQILDMQLPPFQELSEARLAAEFGVSRTPVREAFARLARRGLVEILPQRGTIVSPLSENLIAKSRFIREALERPLARLAAERLTPEIAALLKREIVLQQAFAGLGADQDFLQSDDRFHSLIAKAAGFETIWDDVREAKFHMDRIRRLSLLSQEHMYFIVGEHEEILARLQAHDVKGADDSMTVHLASVMHELDVIRAAHPEYFVRESAGAEH
ncbi:MAG TPA: GntR family transcriptional regulator [Devosia sp.]|jgi:DNA-binding GntR family transcriptional regulator|uniref:GntR family transcriptional regulator n=1 Tax=Devosia sp. TaxID=1871048 RepID=UPI002DDCDC71|nr:GntR family transcriptional regulator [Devosia sp.]HEV2513769.1 GntR family transcriptional regulator [Devosia sp.]